MTATVRTVQSAEMSGRARFERWREKFEAAFFQPLVYDMLRATFQNLTPEQLEQLRRDNPEAMRRVLGRMEGE